MYGINKNFEKESLLPCYEVFEQRNPTDLNIELEHISVMKSEDALAHEGKYWQLRGETTPGDGNCLYHAFAQQIQKDRTKMDLSETANTLYVDSAATAKLISHFKIFEIIDKRDKNS